MSPSVPELLLVLLSRFRLESRLSFRLSDDFERDFVDLESLDTDRDFRDLLLSSLFDLDFFDLECDLLRDLEFFDFDLLDFKRSCERDLDLLDFDRDRDRDLLDLDFDRDLLNFDAGERDLRDFESRLGDLDLDFFERVPGDLDLDLDFFVVLSNDSGDGVRLFFFLPSAMLINFACNLDIATAASGLVLTGINGIAFSGCGESSRSTLISDISFPLSLREFLLGDLEVDLLFRLDLSRSLCRSLDLLLLLLSLSRSLLLSLLCSFDEARSFSSFFILSVSSFSFSRSFSFSFSAKDA